MLDLSKEQFDCPSADSGVFRRALRLLFLRLIALPLAIGSALAADDSSATRPSLCRVTVTVDESHKATCCLQIVENNPEDRSSCDMCQQKRLGNGIREFNYCFGDPKAIDFLSGALGNPVNVSLIKELRMLRLQPAAAKGRPLPCAAFTLPYRVTIPFTLSFDVLAPDESGGETGAYVSLSPLGTGVSAKEQPAIALGFRTADRFTKVVGVSATEVYPQKSNELGDWKIDLANNPDQVSFQLPLPAKASDSVCNVEIGTGGAIACGLSRLCVTTKPSPVVGLGLLQIGDVIIVQSVADFCPARKAGIRPGDQLLSVSGREMFKSDEAVAAIANAVFGENTVMEIGRRGKSISLTLAMREPNTPPEVDSEESSDGGADSRTTCLPLAANVALQAPATATVVPQASTRAGGELKAELTEFEKSCKQLCFEMAAACRAASGSPALTIGAFADTKFTGVAGKLDAQSKGTGLPAGCANGTASYFILYSFLIMEATARMAGQEPPQGGVVEMLNGWMRDGSGHLAESGDADKYWTQVAATYCLLQLYGDGNGFNAALDAQLVREGQQPLVNQLVGGIQRLRGSMCDRLAKQYAASVEVGLKKFGPPRIAVKTTEAVTEE